MLGHVLARVDTRLPCTIAYGRDIRDMVAFIKTMTFIDGVRVCAEGAGDA
ncbi:MAG: hypothetical protein GDA54_03090 [Alphaproteobacteria bacterium GM7ARS4]|nr:hypothetical protein [Alphaproteobacteria bacterium GM7ARS4]